MKEKRYNRLQMVAVALALLLTSLLLPSCSNEDGNSPELPENKLYTLTIHLQPSASYTPVTKAAGDEWEEEEDAYERKIEECWVVVLDEQGNWKATVSTNDFNINNNHTDSESSATVKLPIGKYTLFAFANLNSLSDNDIGIIKELVDGKKSDGTPLTKTYLEAKAVSLKDKGLFKLTDGKAIPMSSYATETTVQENQENTATLTLFRMLGKVAMTIDNQTGNSITLKSLSMGKFRNGEILLIPYSEGEITLNSLPETAIQEQLQPKFPTGITNKKEYVETITIPESGQTIKQNEKLPYMFYAFETGSDTNNNNEFEISIQVNDRGLSTKKIDYSFIRRNDWIKIPIIISNVQSTIKFLNARMPIGGLPPEVVFGEKDGVQILVDAVNTIDPTYAGPIDIEVTLESINSVQNPSILYTSDTAEGSARSTAILENNENGLLIDKTTGYPLVTDGANKVTFDVEASPSDNAAKNKCYFRVWAQELGRNSSATIKLTLLAEYGTETPKRRIEIPYTIIIQNYKNTSTTN